LAAGNARLGEKHSVTLTIVPSPTSVRQALSPAKVIGSYTAMFSAILAVPLHHALLIRCGNRGADGSGHDRRGLGNGRLEVAAELGNQRGIGRYAIKQAGCCKLPDSVTSAVSAEASSWLSHVLAICWADLFGTPGPTAEPSYRLSPVMGRGRMSWCALLVYRRPIRRGC
jgi:hypothetical protein